MTFTIVELAKMWKAGQRAQVRAAIFAAVDPQEAAEALANLVEHVEETDGVEEALGVALSFTHH